MSTQVTFTSKGLKRGTLVNQPGWYQVKIERTEVALTKAKDSNNYIIHGEIVGGPDPRMVGVPVQRMYNEKAIEMSQDFFAALGAEVKEGAFDFSAANGQVVEAMITRATSTNNNDFNDIKAWRKLEKKG